MSGDTFDESKFTIISEWNTQNDKFRLLKMEAGPNRLQVIRDGKWEQERGHYEWAVLTSRIATLEKENEH